MHQTEENPDYLTKQLITCLGNKRSLLSFLGQALDHVKRQLGKKKLEIGDFFSGSGVVSRFFKAHAIRLVSNDLERYAEVSGRCYLSNKEQVDWEMLKDVLRDLEKEVENPEPGFITELYAPEDDADIRKGERVFYTTRNACVLDAACKYIKNMPEQIKPFLLGPLLSEASIHANTSGVFKGFHKNEDGIGCFGGKKGDALERITRDIDFHLPVLSRFSTEVEVCRGDANSVARKVKGLDLVYLDPPYNQHPYGSNYFMLNLIADYKKPSSISKVSGIPKDWNRSAYNSRKGASFSLFDLIDSCDAPFVLVSYNSEGYVPHDDFLNFMRQRGKATVWATSYNAYRGSRNLRARDIKVKEYLYLLEKK